MLSSYRVIDLTDERGQLAGQMLAQLGAEVIAVEPPGGSNSRARGPFAGDVVHPDHSLQHWAYNRGKRSVVLDLAGSSADRAAFMALVAGADVLIDSARPGDLARLGLGHDELAAINPALVHASITPFGCTGPAARWAATDLTVWAAAGALAITGDSDRAPVRVSVPQAFAHGAGEAAGAIVAALYERGRSGRGQHIDVSAQQAAAQATQAWVLASANGADEATRESGGINVGPLRVQLMWPCADGHVSVTLLFGDGFGAATTRLMRCVWEEGHCDEATRDKDWFKYFVLLLTGDEPFSEFERVKACVGAFCMAHTKSELLALALDRQVLIAPVSDMADVVTMAHFAERDYWDVVDGVRFPGPFAQLSGTPLRRLGAPPRLGADTEAVLDAPPRRPNAPPPVHPAPTARPLDGLKVLDFMWVVAGPAGTRVLTDMGATVVRIESTRRFDATRGLAPYKDGVQGADSLQFANLNAGKLGVTIDPSTPDGQAVILDLVRWADVVTESFSPKAMKAWGLDYESLRQVNPSLIMLSSCLYGQSGSLSKFAGYGTMAAAMTGFLGVTGWPDRPPCGPFGAYTDYIAPRFANAALLAAVDHRRRTGEGQYIDFSQAEGSLHALGPAVLEYTVNGRVWQRAGNDDPQYEPHGVFPSAGEDRWVAVSCATDEDREALARMTGGLDHASITAWTSARSARSAAELLQGEGVAAYPVQTSADAYADPQLAHRAHFVSTEHAALGPVVIEGPRHLFSRTPSTTTAPGPTLGQHGPSVLGDILGYDDERFVELLTSGALE